MEERASKTEGMSTCESLGLLGMEGLRDVPTCPRGERPLLLREFKEV